MLLSISALLSQNIVDNGNFENGALFPSFWGVEINNGDYLEMNTFDGGETTTQSKKGIITDDAEVISGDYSAKIKFAFSDQHPEVTYSSFKSDAHKTPIEAGVDYVFSMDMHLVSGGEVQMELVLPQWDENGAFLGQEVLYQKLTVGETVSYAHKFTTLANAVDMYMDFQAKSYGNIRMTEDATIIFDNISIVKVETTGPNLFFNGSFEYGYTNWRTIEVGFDGSNWLVPNVVTDPASISKGIIVTDPSFVTKGEKAAKYTWNPDPKKELIDLLIDTNVPNIEEYENYTLKLDALLPEGSDATQLLLICTFYSAADEVLSDNQLLMPLTADGTYHELVYDIDQFAPEGTAKAAVGVRFRDAEGNFTIINSTDIYLDNLQFGITGTLGLNKKLESDSSISFYPNPAANFISVSSKSKINKVEIYSITGQLIMEVNSNFDAISLDNLVNRSTYLLKVQSELGISVKKLIKK